MGMMHIFAPNSISSCHGAGAWLCVMVRKTVLVRPLSTCLLQWQNFSLLRSLCFEILYFGLWLDILDQISIYFLQNKQTKQQQPQQAD